VGVAGGVRHLDRVLEDMLETAWNRTWEVFYTKGFKKGSGYSAVDFAGPNTLELMYEKVNPALNEVMEEEFDTVLGGVDVRAEDIREVRKQAEILKRFLCSYIDGAAAMYCIHGAWFYGDESARNEVEAKRRKRRRRRKR
jgi:hypothetical protein